MACLCQRNLLQGLGDIGTSKNNLPPTPFIIGAALFMGAMSDYPNGHYDCWVSWPGGWHKIFVGPPAALSRAVDSPKAFDDVAHAAISFTDNEVKDKDDFQPEMSDSGWVIRRSNRR